MGKWCLHASLFLGNKDMFKNYKGFDFWHVLTADIGGTKPWKNNCSLIWKLFKFLMTTCWLVWNERMLAHWTHVSDRCPLGYLYTDVSRLWFLSRQLVYEVFARALWFQFQRRRPYYVINILLPTLLMSVCVVWTFILPTASGERIGYSLTILLSFTVFLTVTNGLLPSTSQQTPTFGKSGFCCCFFFYS